LIELEGGLNMGVEVSGLLGLIWLIIVIWAIVRTVESRVKTGVKVLWIVALLLFPMLGLILWLLLGPRH
jgi:hypothetical protein